MNSNSTKKSHLTLSLLRAALLPVLVLLFLFGNESKAQLLYTETFDVAASTNSLPFGWSQGKYGGGTDPDNYWDRLTAGANPVAAPFGGTGAMMRYRSNTTTAGEASYLASKKFQMNGGGMPVFPGGAVFSFYFYRDNSGSYLATPDRIEVYVNDSAIVTGGATGATLLTETGSSLNSLYRSHSLAPNISPASGWTQYSYLIQNTAPYNGASVYVMIVAISAQGNDMYIDNFSITSYPGNQVISSANVINQNTNNTGVNQANQEIITCNMVVTGAKIPKVLTNMDFNTNGSTNPPSDITNAKLYFTGGTPTFDINSALLIGTYNQPWATNFSFLTAPSANYSGLASFSGLEHGDNYFWLLYDIPATATPLNYVDADWIGYTATGIAALPTTQTLPGSRLIDVAYCIPAYSAGTSWANYNQNDYVRELYVTGGTAPDISNTKNWMTALPHVNASENCNVGPYPKDCPFQKHGPDYELFAESGHPGYTAGRSTTKTFISNGTTVYNINYRCGTWYGSNYIAAFIDFNKDGDFIDPGEKIAQSPNMAALSFYNVNFTVPTTATAGKTRLRVREVYADSNIDPCNFRTWGETEDYVITIIPDCPVFTGYTTWIGLTSNWNDPNNWCPAIVPTTTTNVRLPGVASGSYTYVKPVIVAGVAARAQKLRIEQNDTLFVDATTGSSLQITDSLKIWTPTSALKINTTFLDTVQLMNGTLNRPLENPLNNYERSRSFLLITQADLLAQGLVTGDTITNLLIHLQRKSNGNVYKNLSIKYWYTGTSVFGTGIAAVVPPVVGPPAAAVTIWSGDLNPAAYVPVAGNYGTIDLPLMTRFAWTGTTNNMVIEICYDNVGFGSTGTPDEIRFTQTSSLRRYMTWRAVSNATDFPKAGCSLLASDAITTLCTWVSGTKDITVTGGAGVAATIKPGMLSLTVGVTGYVVSVAGNVVTMSNNSSSTQAVATNVTFTFVDNRSQNYRPNITFKTSRPYIKYPVSVAGHWENNGAFIPAVSRVTLNGTVANQKVSGTSTTTFYDLNTQNANHVMRMTDFIVQDSLRLVNGRLKLNNGLVTLLNQSPSALTYVAAAGDIQAEMDVIGANAFPFGRLKWDMGSTTGPRTIPFINSSGVRIPMIYNVDAGSHNTIIGTYSTLQDNTNLPSPEVTNILGVNNAVGGGWGSGGWAMVDRYYFIDNTLGIAPQADITFRYAPLEQAQAGNLAMKAQRWIPTTDIWEFPFYPTQTFTAGSPNSVVVDNYTAFDVSSWWTIVGDASPLPVSLLEFKAEQHDDRVKLLWSTATEVNNSHFEIERTVDNEDFAFIGRVNSLGSGTNRQEYAIWDNNPVQGVQYYYLKQYDYDGEMERFGPVTANFSKDLFDIVTTTVSSSDKGLTVVFNYNSEEPYSYRIMDMTGRVIVAKDRNVAVEGLNVIDIDATLAKGVYHIVLQNSSKVVSRKFFY